MVLLLGLWMNERVGFFSSGCGAASNSCGPMVGLGEHDAVPWGGSVRGSGCNRGDEWSVAGGPVGSVGMRARTTDRRGCRLWPGHPAPTHQSACAAGPGPCPTSTGTTSRHRDSSFRRRSDRPRAPASEHRETDASGQCQCRDLALQSLHENPSWVVMCRRPGGRRVLIMNGARPSVLEEVWSERGLRTGRSGRWALEPRARPPRFWGTPPRSDPPLFGMLGGCWVEQRSPILRRHFRIQRRRCPGFVPRAAPPAAPAPYGLTRATNATASAIAATLCAG